jgi:hypothetical protein
MAQQVAILLEIQSELATFAKTVALQKTALDERYAVDSDRLRQFEIEVGAWRDRVAQALRLEIAKEDDELRSQNAKLQQELSVLRYAGKSVGSMVVGIAEEMEGK